MGRNRWHIVKEDHVLTMARRLPVRFDFSATASFPMCSRARLAQQIRQDMWRALQNIHGLSPIVRIEVQEHTLTVQAGGQVDGIYPRQQAIDTVSTLLNSPRHRTRWIAYAGGRHHA